jgi:6-phosphofructokinase
MAILKGNVMFGQSGGPTSVINSSAAGVFTEALKHPDIIGKVYGALHGIVGILNEDFIDIGLEDPDEIMRLKWTPSSILGSCRYKLADAKKDETDYERILDVFKKYNIRYFFYNGGNDSMDTCDKVSGYLEKRGYECRVIGVPKTIDNDLTETDHCPGFGSAAKFVATTAMEIYLDSRVYDRGMVAVVEVMGRHAGWLAAASALASYKGCGPDFIYLPEVPFNIDTMLGDIENKVARDDNALIYISEGIKSNEGKLLAEYAEETTVDAFGHKQLGGSAETLSRLIGSKLGCKVRGIELSLLQRSASHIASAVDVEEAFIVGQVAVQSALEGKSDVMVGFERPKNEPYRTMTKLFPLALVANHEKLMPREWINDAGNQVLSPYIDYALPLIQGENNQEKEDGLPRFAKFKRIRAGRSDA